MNPHDAISGLIAIIFLLVVIQCLIFGDAFASLVRKKKNSRELLEYHDRTIARRGWERGQRGFGVLLIEILVGMAVLAIIAGMALVNVATVALNNQQAMAASSLRTMDLANFDYYQLRRRAPEFIRGDIRRGLTY